MFNSSENYKNRYNRW